MLSTLFLNYAKMFFFFHKGQTDAFGKSVKYIQDIFLINSIFIQIFFVTKSTSQQLKNFAILWLLTGVTIQFWMDHIHFPILLCLFGRLCRPRPRDQIISTPVLFQTNQIERNPAELSRASTLQEQYLIVFRYIPIQSEHKIYINLH